MTFPWQNPERGLACGLWLACGIAISGHAQPTVLHLLNGDRVAGTILSENATSLTLSNSWNPALVVPLAQVERRELLTANGTNSFASAAAPLAGNTGGKWSGGKLPASKTTWGGEAELGTDVQRGATDSANFYGRTKFTYARPYQSDPKQFFRSSLSYEAQYGKTDSVTSANRMNGSSKSDLDLSRLFYTYNLGSAGFDTIRLINLQYEEGPGLGYHAIQRDTFRLNLEFGGDYQVQERSDRTRSDSFYYRLSEEINWSLTRDVTFTERFEYFPEAHSVLHYRLRFDSTLSMALLKPLSLNLTVSDVYDSQPATAVPNNDIRYRTTLGIKF